jgi:hypothetical protein
MGKECWIRAAQPIEPVPRALGPINHPLVFAARASADRPSATFSTSRDALAADSTDTLVCRSTVSAMLRTVRLRSSSALSRSFSCASRRRAFSSALSLKTASAPAIAPISSPRVANAISSKTVRCNALRCDVRTQRLQPETDHSQLCLACGAFGTHSTSHDLCFQHGDRSVWKGRQNGEDNVAVMTMLSRRIWLPY